MLQNSLKFSFEDKLLVTVVLLHVSVRIQYVVITAAGNSRDRSHYSIRTKRYHH